MRTCFVPLLLLFTLPLVSSAELKIDGSLHRGYAEIQVENRANHNVSFSLIAQLRRREERWVVVADLSCGGNYTIEPKGLFPLRCNYLFPETEGDYKIFVRARIFNSTYTYKNFPFSVSKTPSSNPAQGRSSDLPPPLRFEPVSSKKVEVQIVSAPDLVKTGEEFVVVANVTSHINIDLEIYSYVYSGRKCYSLYGWKGNSVRYHFIDGESKTINLTDSVVHTASNGTYRLKVRVRGEKGVYDTSRSIGVVQTPYNLSIDLPHPVSESESGISIILPLLAVMPLSVIILRKIL